MKLGTYFEDDEPATDLSFSARVSLPSEANHLYLMPISGGIKIVGREAVVDDPDTTGTTEDTIIIVITATDPGGLTLDRNFTFRVEARPKLAKALPDFTIKKSVVPASPGVVDDYIVAGNLRFTDEDDEFSNIAITNKSSDKTVVADDDDAKSTNALTLTLTGDIGDADVTIRAREPIGGTGVTGGVGQWVEDTIRVSVTDG